MKKLLVTLCIGGLIIPLFAGPPRGRHDDRHHHKKDGGLHLAAEIVGLVGDVLAPRPKVVVVRETPPPPPPRRPPPPPPRRYAPPPPPPPPPPPRIPYYGYDWYNGLWVPHYNGWYFYNGGWRWGRHGRPPAPPRWRPDPRRPAPPRPHGGPPRHGPGAHHGSRYPGGHQHGYGGRR